MGNKCWKRKIFESNDILESLMSNENYFDTSDKIFKNYFKIIKNKFFENYKENRNNLINISLSLEKRDFETIITSKKVLMNKKMKFIYWKDYFLRFLNKMGQKGYTWADELLK